MNNLECLIISFCIVFSIIVFIDFLFFTIKKAPKSTTLTNTQWNIGLLSAIIAAYWIINGMNLF